MIRRLPPAALVAFIASTALAALVALPALAQPAPAQGKLSDDALQHLLAPVALYPDQVLTDILAAATYPGQVVEADRFRTDPSHAKLSGQALLDAAAGETWDPSVKDLLLFPQVLQNMDNGLNWTEQLGQAVIAQQADVMTAVQELRAKAELAGTLATSSNDLIANEGPDVVIAPPSPQDIYLPDYQPQCVFGVDPACDGVDGEIGWGAGFVVPYGYIHWGRIDWPNRRIIFAAGQHGEPTRGGLVNVWHPQTLVRAAAAAPAFHYAPPEYAPRQANIFRPRQAARTVFRPAQHVMFAAPRAVGRGHR